MEEGITVIHLIQRAIEDNLALEIDYINNSNEKSTRLLSDISISKEHGAGYISAYCHLREEIRTFKISHIIDARIVSNPNRKPVLQNPNYEFDSTKPIFNLYGEEF